MKTVNSELKFLAQETKNQETTLCKELTGRPTCPLERAADLLRRDSREAGPGLELGEGPWGGGRPRCL